MKPTQADYDRIANWIDASYEVAIMFRDLEGALWDRRQHRSGLSRAEAKEFKYLDFIDDSIQFWRLMEVKEEKR